MDIQKSSNENVNQDSDEGEETVQLPPDTLAILHEFLRNRDLQNSSEREEIFEENWV